MKLVKFSDGTFGVRKLTLSGYLYATLFGYQGWKPMREHGNYCRLKGSEEEARNEYLRHTDKGVVVQ